MVLTRASVIVVLHIAVGSVGRKSQQKVCEIITTECAGEVEVAVIIGSDEPEARAGPQEANVEARFERVPPVVKRSVVVDLESAIEIGAFNAAHIKSVQIVEREVRKTIKRRTRKAHKAK